MSAIRESVPATTSTHLRWPPPGLEPVHGEAWEVITRLGLGGFVLVLPLLVAVAVAQPFWSLGLYARAPWVPVASSFLGLLLVLGGVERLIRVLRVAARAAEQGHSRSTVLAAFADSGRDTGFLLQGARYFGSLADRERAWLLRARMLSALLYIAGSAWFPLGFALALVLAGRGVVQATDLIWFLTLLPAAVLLLAAISLRLFEQATLARARRSWNASVRRDRVLEPDIHEWNAHYDARFAESPFARRGAVRPRLMTGGIVAAIVLSALLLVPIATLALTTLVGPVLASIALPNASRTERRAAAVERLRPYVLPSDPALTPRAAGDLALIIGSVGSSGDEVQPPARAPLRSYATGWGLPPRVPVGADIERFAELSESEREQYAVIAAHPAHADIAALARAGSADLAGARWLTPFPAGMSAYELPIPRFAGLREGAQAHVGKAIHEAANGQLARADTTVREVISAGFVLMDNSTTLIEALIGIIMVETGGDALEKLYRASGRIAEASALRAGADAAAAALDARVTGSRPDPQSMLRASVGTVTRNDALRGLRWELLASTQLATACANANRTVFGPDAQQQRFLERARRGLVRYPAEAELFELVTHGAILPAEDASELPMLSRFMALTLGANDGCATLLRALASF